VFAFDFRNHGESQADPTYDPLQWVSDLEVRDLRAALDYLRSREDRDPAGLALFGVSRGGGAALCATANDPGIWAVVSDGAFPTRGTMVSYVLRWAEIPIRSKLFLKLMPYGVYVFAAWAGRVTAQRRRGRVYPSLERAVARIAPRPWLLIHGERDVYIGPEIALDLFGYAGSPKESWIVPGAKHNRCREADPARYRKHLAGFLTRHAPRRTPVAVPGRVLTPAADPVHIEVHGVANGKPAGTNGTATAAAVGDAAGVPGLAAVVDELSVS
jgi:pimeloyl-ACP methyl ester carboxylesterase